MENLKEELINAIAELKSDCEMNNEDPNDFSISVGTKETGILFHLENVELALKEYNSLKSGELTLTSENHTAELFSK